MQRAFIEYDHMIQALAANGPNYSLDVRSLLWLARRPQYFTNPEFFYLIREFATEDPVAFPYGPKTGSE